jgi:hypothetical protein
MTTNEFDDRISSWIGSRDPGPAPGSLRMSVERVTQDDRGPLGRQSIRQPWAIALAAAVVIVAIGGIALMASLDVGRTRVGSTPTPAVSPATSSDPVLPRTEAIQPGRYVMSAPRMAVHLTVPAGWHGNGMGVGKAHVDLIITPYDIAYVVPDVCAPESDAAPPTLGKGAEALTTALLKQQGVERSGPTDLTLGGYPAKRLVLTPTCAGAISHGVWMDPARAYGLTLKSGEIGNLYVVDVDGDRLVVTYQSMGGASTEEIAQMEAMVASIGIEPKSGGGSELVTLGGWLPIGPHSIKVDGVPLTFTVPALDQDRGWALYGNREITKDTVGSQGAEAMIYWTAFPNGVDTNPCAVLHLPVTGSIVDLADAVGGAPGAILVTRPTSVTLGGRPARHLVLAVADDRGCDPKFLFSSEPPGGGPGWWRTDAGDTVRVWILDVGDRRFFVVGESKTAASEELQQEIDDIVASIRFE